MSDLEKIEWANLPVSVPKPWLDFFQSRSRQLGISRNAAIGLALKLGAPLLDAHVLLMGELIKENCRKITEQGGAISEILEPPGDLFSMIDGMGDRRKSNTSGRGK